MFGNSRVSAVSEPTQRRRNLERAQCLDLVRQASVPQGVGSLPYALLADVFEQLPHELGGLVGAAEAVVTALSALTEDLV